MQRPFTATLALACTVFSSCALERIDFEHLPCLGSARRCDEGEPALPPEDAGRAEDAGADAAKDTPVDDAAARDTGDLAPDASLPRVCAAAVPGAPPDDAFRRVRTTVDLPDDLPGEYQVHLLYVEPSERVPSVRLDESGAIRRSTKAWNEWLALQTGGSKFRFDTCGGVLDVTHVRLPSRIDETEMALGTRSARAGTANIRDRLEAELKTVFDAPNKLYLVYYEGLALGFCGGAPLPPVLPGHFPAIYLGGLFSTSPLTEAAGAGATQFDVFDPAQTRLPSAPFSAKLDMEDVEVLSISGTTVTLSSPLRGSHSANALLVAASRPPDCRTNAQSRDGSALGYLDYTAAHEVVHSLGIVADTAPYHNPATPGHLTAESAGGTNDLMYQGTLPWTCGNGVDPDASASSCVLDPARENYWGLSSDSSNVDLARSVFLDPKPIDAQLPAGW